MQLEIVNKTGGTAGTVDVADAVFGAEVKEHLLWEIVKSQLAARRAGTHKTKTRSEVRGGGRKPYKQKGTGNARQGSSRAPHFVGGGTVFGPQPRDYSYTVPKKVKRLALASALSLRASEKKVVVVDDLTLASPKTKEAASVLANVAPGKSLVVDNTANVGLTRAMRNLVDAKWIAPEGLNVYDILNHDVLVIARGVLSQIEARVVPPAKVESADASAVG